MTFVIVRSVSLQMSGVNFEQLKSAIRDIPDFPKPGIIFKDITPILGDGQLFRDVIDHLGEEAEKATPTKVVEIDARGFLFGAAVAYKLGRVAFRFEKRANFPTKRSGPPTSWSTAMPRSNPYRAIEPGERVVLVNDLLATGGTSGAAVNLVQKVGGIVGAALFVIELEFLDGQKNSHPTSPLTRW